MEKLNPKNALFENLATNPPVWWETLVNDEDIYIEIRKDNYIDVYYNGGNIIKELRYKDGAYTGKIHYKYFLPEICMILLVEAES